MRTGGLLSICLTGVVVAAAAGAALQGADASPAAVRASEPPGPRAALHPHGRALGSAEANATRPRRAGTLVARVRPGASVPLRSRPGGSPIAVAASSTEFGSPRVLSVAARRGRWLGVIVPERPNGRLAWVLRDPRLIRLRRVLVSLRVDLSARRLELRTARDTVARIPVTVGAPASPTPTGTFAVTDKLPGPRFHPTYGCCILALSGSQPRPPAGWGGGTRLAVHGVSPGAAVTGATSAGCVRATDRDLGLLMRHVPLGAPVLVEP